MLGISIHSRISMLGISIHSRISMLGISIHDQKLPKKDRFLSSFWSKGDTDPGHVDFHAFSDFHAWYFHSFSEVRRCLGIDFDGQHIYIYIYVEHIYNVYRA